MTLLLLMSGCDLGTYGGRYGERLGELQERSTRAAHLHASYQRLDGPGGESLGAQIRMPKLFDGQSSRLRPSDAATKPDQAGPPGMPIPLAYTFERYIEADGEKLPIYCYVGAIPVAESDGAALEAKIDELIARVISDGPKWADVSYPALEGEPVVFRSLKVSAAQPFVVVDPQGVGGSRSLEGQLFFHLKTVGANHVLIGFRYPSQLADRIEFPQAMEAALGTFGTF